MMFTPIGSILFDVIRIPTLWCRMDDNEPSWYENKGMEPTLRFELRTC